MIRIRKPEQAPVILRDAGAQMTADLCRKVEAGEPPTFENKIYGHPEVKDALRAAQHDKCCFCEAKLGHTQFGDIEHFRPKKQAQQDHVGPATVGYYWLAYAWTNLYLSCEVCNRRHKRGLFPLANPERRISSHHRAVDVDSEQPLFVDPGSDEPTAFIEFRREYAAPVERSVRGSVTIQALELNRPALVEHRRERRKLLLACVVTLARALPQGVSDDEDLLLYLLGVLGTAVTEGGEYASMTRSLLRGVAPWRASWAMSPRSLLDALRSDTARGCVFHIDPM